jgi:hypothetical protein
VWGWLFFSLSDIIQIGYWLQYSTQYEYLFIEVALKLIDCYHEMARWIYSRQQLHNETHAETATGGLCQQHVTIDPI